MTERAPELDVTHARQGRRGRHAFVILVTSLALVIIAFAAVWLSHADDVDGRGQREADPASARMVTETPNTVEQTPQTAPPGSVAEQAGGSPGEGG